MVNSVCLPCDRTNASVDSLQIINEVGESNLSLREDVNEVPVNISNRCVTKPHDIPLVLELNRSELEDVAVKDQISNLMTFEGEPHDIPHVLELNRSELEDVAVKDQISNLMTFEGNNYQNPSMSNVIVESVEGTVNGHNIVPVDDANLVSSTRSIQKAIKSTSQGLNNWETELKVGVIVNGVYVEKYNILEAINPLKGMLLPYIYFDPLKFSVQDGFNGKGWKALLQHLERESFSAGFSICCNGYGSGSKNKYRKLVCKHNILYRNSMVDRKSKTNYRVTRKSNDRLNSRGSAGRSMERRSRTCRPTKAADRCPFSFHIAYDLNGFYIKNGVGCSSHYGHPKAFENKYNYPIRLLTDNEKHIAKSIIDADASKGIVRNVIGRRTGQIVSLQACHYLGTLGNDLKRLACLDGLSSSDRIINFFQDKSYDYILLYNSMNQFPQNTVDLVNDNYISSSALYSNTKFMIPPNEQEDASKYASDNRSNRNLTNEQNLLVALAWVVPSERRLFQLFPETLFVDSVEDTNNEGRPLLTMSGCDSNGKMFTFLRAFLPNQRTWSFRWIFLHVLPTMFSKETIGRIRVIISDGDSQEYQQIDVAISTFCPHVMRLRCGWHVIDRGWMRHGPKSNHYKDKIAFKAITTNIRNWMFSWTSSACETEQEYNVSKYLFEKYVFSKYVIDKLDSNFSKLVIHFYKDYVEPILPFMLFYKRKHIRHFDNYTNVKIEGTYRGIKHGCTPVTPSTSLFNSVAILSNVAERSCGASFKDKTTDVLSKKTWISIPCGDDLNLRGEQLLTTEWSKRKMYLKCRSSDHQWLVTYNDKLDQPKQKEYTSIYPLFRRIRTITITKSVIKCSCKLFERFGIPCRHMFAVLDSLPKYKQPSINDVSVIYWKAYSLYCYNGYNKDEKSLKLGQLLADLRSKDIEGPSCPTSWYKCIPICTKLDNVFIQNGIECRNYDTNDVNDIQNVLNIPSGYGVSMSLSQGNEEYFETQIENCFTMNSESCHVNTDSFKTLAKMNVYAELFPIFKELVQFMESVGDKSYVAKFKSVLTTELNNAKARYKDLKKKSSISSAPSGKFISCHQNHIKRRKTHGTNYYRK